MDTLVLYAVIIIKMFVIILIAGLIMVLLDVHEERNAKHRMAKLRNIGTVSQQCIAKYSVEDDPQHIQVERDHHAKQDRGRKHIDIRG